VVNECGIDQEVIKNQDDGLADDVLANRRSLSALEYLLFEHTLISKCSAFAEPKAKEWSAKSVFEKKKDRCAYAQKVANDVQKNAELIRNAWSPDKENFTVALIDKTVYGKDVNAAVNALTDSLFAFEDFRDTELAIPLGIHKDCIDPSGKCLDSIEHPWSGIAAEAAVAQIQGFQEAFFGSKYDKKTAFGFDDYLAAKGHQDVAESIKANLALSLQGMKQLAAQDPSLKNTILNAKKENCDIFEGSKESLDFVCQVYKDIQSVTWSLKTDVMILLALQAPTGHAGDGD
jgi:predicted lipoprotein